MDVRLTNINHVILLLSVNQNIVLALIAVFIVMDCNRTTLLDLPT